MISRAHSTPPAALVRALAVAALVACGLGAASPPRAAAPDQTAAPATATTPFPQASSVDFNFHIRPLLSDRCFACHGPDDNARKARLDLRSREQSLKESSSGAPVIAPGDPDGSELFRRITTSDVDERMPPPASKLPPLTPEEIARVRQWILEGAPYKEHWAFTPIARVTPPQIPPSIAASPRNEIDLFVWDRLAREGLEPQPEAPRETLIRRVSLDLIGLPPTPEEIRAFVSDAAPDAYERLVQRLLDSPRYGERMAQEWLDLARYADTYGYQSDVDVDFSPWRDWVIRAFNENLPWDDFITWQLAGDLLPNPTRDQQLATAFNRLHRQTNEGGSIEEEFRVEYVSDRVHTMGAAFLGLTLECARCHDHKYDPVSQRDYYSLSAFFNSIDESGLYSHFTRAIPTPVMLLWDDATRAKHAAQVESIRQTEKRLSEIREAARPAFDEWRAQSENLRSIAPPAPVAHAAFESIVNGGAPDSQSTNLIRLHDSPVLAPGKSGQAMLFSGDNSADFPVAGRFGRAQPFSFSLWIKPAESAPRAVVFHYSRAWTDSGSRGYEFLLEHGKPVFALIHFWPGNAIAVRGQEEIPPGVWSHITIAYDGSSRASGIRIFRDGRPLAVEIVRDNLYKDIHHRGEWGDADAGNVRLTLAGRFRDNGFRNGLIDEFKVFDRELTALEAALLAGREDAVAAASEADLFELFLARHHAPWQEVLATLQSQRATENDLINPAREIMVMKELPEPRETRLLRRGAYDAPGDVVTRDVPGSIFPWPADAPRNRLGLAQWMTDPRHPLTARVAVNRIWKLHFGRGLVATTWDFGAQGELPTHPELLDWLARRFIDSGWDRKAMHQLIVTSATYRQSSRAPRLLAERDPDNRLLARGPKHRLDAEQIRDSALRAAGLLSPRIGGPSVKPYQPRGVWEDAGTGKTYTQDHGEKLYRRSLYTFWRRTAPPPNMLTFDATTREVCAAKREITTTPLQALVLLNDPQFLEAARHVAEDLLMAHPGDPRAQARAAFQRVLGRDPDPVEADILERLRQEQLDYFLNHPAEAEEYLGVGESPRAKSLPPAELAAMTVLSSTLMNHDGFVMKR